MKPNDPAFPLLNHSLPYHGMTLRHYYIGQALTGLLADPNHYTNIFDVAKSAIEYAEALMECMKELEKKK